MSLPESEERTQTEKWIAIIERFETESAEAEFTDTERTWEILIGIKRWLRSLIEN